MDFWTEKNASNFGVKKVKVQGNGGIKCAENITLHAYATQHAMMTSQFLFNCE